MNDLSYDHVREFSCSNEAETAALGAAVGHGLTPGLVIGLSGTLGAGKTRLTQAIGTELGIPPGQVVSPTFTICVPHEGRLPFLHLDAYRINQLSEVDELGLDELAEDGVVLIVEWVERIQSCLPPLDLQITITPTGDSSRMFRVQAHSDPGRTLLARVGESLESSAGNEAD